MNRYIKIIMVVMMFSIMGASCKKFLDVKPRGEVLPEKLNDFELLLNGASLFKTYPSLLTFMTDDVYNTKPSTDKTSSTFAYYWNKDLDYETNSSPAIWGMLYNSIYTANVVILNALNTPGESMAKKQAVWAEALTYRADLYFTLLTVFAKAYNPATANTDPGIPLVSGIDITQVAPQRSSVKACFDTIIENVTKAIPFLPVTNINKTRITKNVANAFLSRVYLYMGDYEKSKKYADEVLKSNPQLMDFNTIPVEMETYYIYPVPEQNQEIIWHRGSDIDNYSGGPYFSDELFALYAADDLRSKIFAVDFYGSGQYVYGVFSTSSGIFLSEVLFNKAEALARDNKVSDAMDIVNSIMEKRYKTGTYQPLTANTKEEALLIVLEERRKDLAFISTRWLDMKRLNAKGEMPEVKRTVKETGEVLATLKAGSAYTFEIPKRVQIFNPDMKKNF